jgi:hypothetical protein
VDDWLSVFSKAELRLTIPFELPPVSLGSEDSDAASGKISIISISISILIETSRNLKSSFQDIKDTKKIKKTIGAYTEHTDLIFKDFQKIIHLVTLSL